MVDYKDDEKKRLYVPTASPIVHGVVIKKQLLALKKIVIVAERVGFEPTVRLSAQRFSRPPQSAALAPLLI
jgi:hypothetical protein